MRKSALFSLVFTLFNDSFGWGIVLTIFAPLLLNPENGMLPKDASFSMQTIVLGLLISCYTLTQFLFMPFLGALSDHIGRKRVLKWTILAAALSFAASGLAILYNSLSLLFLSRTLAGIFSANSSTAQAAIADISSSKDKGKNLALAGIAGGLSWVLGPPIGGFLSSPGYFPGVNFATPFFFVTGLFLINYFWLIRSFEETHIKSSSEKHDWKSEIKYLGKLTKIPDMASWLTISFFFFLGWGFYVLFYPALLVQRFNLPQTQIGLLSGYNSVFWLLASVLFNRGLASRFKPEAFILTGLPITGLLCVMLGVTHDLFWWFVAFPVLGFYGSAIWIQLSVLLSNLAGKDNQGKVFGINQALMALAMFASPLFSGFLAALNPSTPLAFSGLILTLTGVFAALYYFRKTRRAQS